MEKIVLFNLKLQKLKKVDMTDLFKLLNLFLLESDGNLRSIP